MNTAISETSRVPDAAIIVPLEGNHLQKFDVCVLTLTEI